MKKIIVGTGIVVVVVVVVVLVGVFFSLNSIVKKGVETVGPQLTKVEIRLGSADIMPFSGGGKLSKLFVGNPEGYKTASAMEFGSIKVAVKIGSVLSDTVVIDEINIQAPNITLEGGIKDNNLTKILDNLSGSSSSGVATTTETPAGPKKAKKFIVKDLVINDGKISINLSMLGGKSISTPLPPIHLQDLGTAENGLTAGELSKAIMKPLVASVIPAAENAVANLTGNLKNLGSHSTDTLNKAVKGFGDMFKK